MRSLTSISPRVAPERLLADLVPPRHFRDARFSTYRADDAYPSQGDAVRHLEAVAERLTTRQRGFFRRRNDPPAVYLDGGFGVGKTHLLTSLAHAVGVEDCAYGTFVEYTNLVGALGFARTVEALAEKKLVCIDEFELDDPGDTVLMSRLLRELADRDTALAATSNTLPDALGEGRFAAEDFLREIQALAARFDVMRVDGEDYRHRGTTIAPQPLTAEQVRETAGRTEGATLDTLDDVVAHLATVHPSRYGAMLDDVPAVGLTEVHQVTEQSVALRLVVLVDRLYDRDIPVLLSRVGDAGRPGEGDRLFTPKMLDGGYRKKYYRALSRLGALIDDGRALAEGSVPAER
ncbi:cell division protein ZapE [Paraoerskovia sediminicola]|uniref:cell division protein ZapE n=1 Tax=Paraoerskovia sediminicola TaxID=1138587 RepID=UPI003305ABF4